VTLREKIDQEIKSQGPMRFSRYMEMCLYDPEFGYYSRHAEQFGKAGDFYTSSDVHAVFGRLMARQFEEMWRVLGSPDEIEILELGPGRGLFAQDVLDWSEKKFPEFFAALHYSLLEQSRPLRARLQVTLARNFESGKASLAGELGGTAETLRSNVSTQGNDAPAAERRKTITSTIIFANEFFDALPVEIVSAQGSLRLTKGLTEAWVPLSDEEQNFLDRYSVNPEPGERLEIPLIAQRYAEAIIVARGFVIAVDYGYTRDQQLAGRHRGTLMTYRKHSASANPYQAPGEQDITAHVNFTALSDALQAQPLVTQSQFLLGIGEANQFADAFEECRVPQERAKVALQLKHLITPSGMGESFHVLVAGKGTDATKISGLNFGRLRRD
jgi:SAM-dependent MidA family methyltransferase